MRVLFKFKYNSMPVLFKFKYNSKYSHCLVLVRREQIRRNSVKREITKKKIKKAICNFYWFGVKLVPHMQGGH